MTEASEQRTVAIYFALVFINSILLNFDSGAIAASLVEISDHFDLDYTSQGLLGSLVYVGLTVSCLGAGIVLQAVRSKPVLTAAMWANTLLNLLFAFAGSRELLLWSRVGVGISQSFLVLYVPIWVDEFAPASRRTLWMSAFQSSIPLGVMVGYTTAGAIARFTDWGFRAPFLIQALGLAPFCLGLLFVPNRAIDVEESFASRQLQKQAERRLRKLGEEQEPERLRLRKEPAPEVGKPDAEDTVISPSSSTFAFSILLPPETLESSSMSCPPLSASSASSASSAASSRASSRSDRSGRSGPDERTPLLLSSSEILRPAPSARGSLSRAAAAYVATMTPQRKLLRNRARRASAAALGFPPAFPPSPSASAATSARTPGNRNRARREGGRRALSVHFQDPGRGLGSQAEEGSEEPEEEQGPCDRELELELREEWEGLRDDEDEDDEDEDEDEDELAFGADLPGERFDLELASRRLSAGSRRSRRSVRSAGSRAKASLAEEEDSAAPEPLLNGEFLSQAAELLLRNPVYLSITLSLCALYFVASGLQLWATKYLVQELGFEPGLVVLAFAGVSCSAPILGVFAGGWLVDRAGGYQGARSLNRSARLACLFGLGAALCALPAAALRALPALLACLWGLLFFGAAVVPAATGILLSSVPRGGRSFSAALSMLLYHLLGYSLGPLLPGLLAQRLGGLRWGWRLLLGWSLGGLLGLAACWWFARRDWRSIKRRIRLAPSSASASGLFVSSSGGSSSSSSSGSSSSASSLFVSPELFADSALEKQSGLASSGMTSSSTVVFGAYASSNSSSNSSSSISSFGGLAASSQASLPQELGVSPRAGAKPRQLQFY